MCVVAPTICLPYNLFSFVAVICKLHTISCSESIICEPFLSNSLTFRDPISTSTLSNPSFCRSYPMLLFSFINILFTWSGILSPYLSLLLFLGLGQVRNQQLKPTQILGVFTYHLILFFK